jgi:serine protease Do
MTYSATETGFGEVAERLRRSTVHITTPGRWGGSGSGVIWNPEGLIVTNAHVTRGAKASVELWDSRSLDAALVARDDRRDLALLQIDAPRLFPATAADSSALRVGELVIAVGNPLGFTGALTTGVVHGIGPLPSFGPLHLLSHRNWIQADLRLAPGNSGGPMADANGRVVGINTMIAGGLALAVPSNAVTRFVLAAQSSTGSGASLGVVVRPVELHGERRGSIGLLVLEVAPGSAAARSSLLPGDVLTGADRNALRSLDDLADAIEKAALDRGVIRLDFLRGGKSARREVAVRLGALEAA